LSSAAIAVERYENQLLVRGFGPSELRKNRRDLTVLHVNARNNETVIDAQVLYEGSADLDKRVLDKAMRKKLERIFQKVAVEVEPRREVEASPKRRFGQAAGGSSGKVAVAVPGKKVFVPPPPEVSDTVPILSASVVRESLVERVRQMASAHLRRKAAQPESFKLEAVAPLKFETKVQAVDVKVQDADTRIQDVDTKIQNVATKVRNVGTKLQGGVESRGAAESLAVVDSAEPLVSVPAVLLDRSAEPRLGEDPMATFGPQKRDRRKPQDVTPLTGDAAIRLRETSFDGVRDRRVSGRPSERKHELQLLPGKDMEPAGAGILEESAPVKRASLDDPSERLLSPMAVFIGLGIAAVLGTAIYVSRTGTGVPRPKPVATVPRPSSVPAPAPSPAPKPVRAAATASVAAPAASVPAVSPTPAASATPNATTKAPVGTAAAASVTPAATPAATKPGIHHSETNLSVWLDQWANAMQGSNATNQASFYADSLDRYLNHGQASNAVVLQDRRREVAARAADWRTTMEEIRVRQTSPTTATVTVMRHASQRLAPPKTNDQYMPEQLTVTMIDGEWKITSEIENKAGAYSLVNN
jgi:hypothetical protein